MTAAPVVFPLFVPPSHRAFVQPMWPHHHHYHYPTHRAPEATYRRDDGISNVQREKLLQLAVESEPFTRTNEISATTESPIGKGLQRVLSLLASKMPSISEPSSSTFTPFAAATEEVVDDGSTGTTVSPDESAIATVVNSMPGKLLTYMAVYMAALIRLIQNLTPFFHSTS